MGICGILWASSGAEVHTHALERRRYEVRPPSRLRAGRSCLTVHPAACAAFSTSLNSTGPSPSRSRRKSSLSARSSSRLSWSTRSSARWVTGPCQSMRPTAPALTMRVAEAGGLRGDVALDDGEDAAPLVLVGVVVVGVVGGDEPDAGLADDADRAAAGVDGVAGGRLADVAQHEDAAAAAFGHRRQRGEGEADVLVPVAVRRRRRGTPSARRR